MNLRDLRYLVALADHRHFGKAAAASFVSQPTLSTQIRKLEEELEVALVERAPRRVMLTPVGREIADRARRILAEAEQLKEVARRSRDPQAGTVRLGIFPTLGPYLLPHVVPQLRARFPRLELLLVEEKTEVLLRQLRDGRLDAGILALPLHDEQLHEEFLFEEPFLLAVPEAHPLAARSTVTLNDLADESLLLLEDGHCLRDQALDVCQLAGAGERTGFRATSLETLRQMVAADVGVTLLPALAVQPPVPRSETIHLLRFAGSPPSRSIAMVWRRSSAMADFLMQLADVFKAIPRSLFTAPDEAAGKAVAKRSSAVASVAQAQSPSKSQAKPRSQSKARSQARSQPQSQAQPNPKPKPKPEPKPQPQPQPQAQPKSKSKSQSHSTQKPMPVADKTQGEAIMTSNRNPAGKLSRSKS